MHSIVLPAGIARAPAHRRRKPRRLRCIALLVLASAACSNGFAAEGNPLEPLDTSSPRATLQSLQRSVDNMLEAAADYEATPSWAGKRQVLRESRRIAQLLDLSEVPPSARRERGTDVYTRLVEVLARVELPPWDEIPGVAEVERAQASGDPLVAWRVPGTDIAIVQIAGGPRAGEFLFSPDVVRNAERFYDLVSHLPRLDHFSLPEFNLPDYAMTFTGHWIPSWFKRLLPQWSLHAVFGQLIWKWLAFAVLIVIVAGVSVAVHRAARGKPEPSGGYGVGLQLRKLATPVTLLILVPAAGWFLELQVNVSGSGATAKVILEDVVLFFAAAWVAWRLPVLVAEWIIRSPRIPDEGLDAHLLRLVGRTVGVGTSIAIVVVGGHQIGLPIYSLVAGVGVGGLALALAARGTIENFMGSLNLYADRPVRVGDFCQYGDAKGTIEDIGLRSTRIRGLDNSLTTVPNADFSQMQIINFDRRTEIMMRPVLGLRYETTPDQMRDILGRLEELLLSHPRLSRQGMRVRFFNYGDFSKDVEVRAYVMTRDWNDFLAVQEEILLRIEDIIVEAGSGFAFPSSTVYLGRDAGLENARAPGAQNHVRHSPEEVDPGD